MRHLARWQRADTVADMTTTDGPLRPCPTCQHDQADQDDHVLIMVLTDPAPMGVMLCPECRCSSTWRANTAASTPDEILETRRLVTERLLRDGYPLPECLR